MDESFKNKLSSDDAAMIDLSTTDEKTQKAKEKNATAMSLFVLTFESPKLLNMVEASNSLDWLGGLVCDLVKRLEKKFKPGDTIAITEMTMKLMVLKLKKGEYPNKLEDNITAIKNKY